MKAFLATLLRGFRHPGSQKGSPLGIASAMGIALIALAAGPASAPAAERFWSAAAPATSGTDGGAGTWNTTDQNWWTGTAAATWDNAALDTAVFAGTAGIVTLGENVTAGGLSFNTTAYRLDLGANALTLGGGSVTLSLAGVATGTISGLVTGTGGVRIDGGSLPTAGILGLIGTATTGWSGTTTITDRQTVALSGLNQALRETAALRLVNGTLTAAYANNATEATLDRISDTAPIQVAGGGGLSWSNGGSTSATAFAETIGEVSIESGEFTVTQLTTKSNGSQTLTLGGLTQAAATASARFAGPLDATRNRIVVTGAPQTPAGQIIGPWATTAADYAVYDENSNVLAADIAASTEDTWTTPTDAYTTGTFQPLTTTRTIAALRLTSTTAGVEVGTAANLETFGILAAAGGTTSNINFSATGSGVITTPSGGGELFVATNFTPAGNGHNRLRVTAPIVDNGGAVTLVKTGPGSLDLSGVNTFSGGLVINSGRIFPAGDSSLGAAGGGITFTGNGYLDVSKGVAAGREITIGEGLVPTLYQNGGTVAAAVTGAGGFATAAPSNNPTLTLSSTANTFTGPVFSDKGVVAFASLADSPGVGPVVIGTGGNNFLVRFVWTGTTKTFDQREFISNNGNGGGMRIGNNGTGPLTVTRDLGFLGTGTTRIFNLAGSATGFSNEFAGRVTDSPIGTVGLLKDEAATWILSATNTYTGTTTLTAGDLAITSDANISGTASPLLFNGGTLKILGTSLASLNPNRPTVFTGTSGLGTTAVGFNIDEPGHVFTVGQDLNMTSGGLTKTGPGTLLLAGTSTYAGTTTIANGVLRFGPASSLSSGSARTVLVQAAGAVAFDFGLDQTTLARVTGTSPGAVAASGTVAANLDFSSGGASLTAASLGAVGSAAYTGTLEPNGTVYRLGGGGGSLDFQSQLSGGRTLVVGGNTAGLGGTVSLSNSANDFTGKTTVQRGTLEIVSLADADGTASSLGAPTSTANGTIDLGSNASPATLRYTGSGHSSDRVLNLAGSTGGAALDASGSGPLVLTAANTAAAGTKTFTLTGTSTANNAIGSIAGSGLSVAKTGPGTWRLTAASSFDGRFTVADGTILAAVGSPSSGIGVFGQATGDAELPLIGDPAAGATGQAAVLLESGVTVSRGLVIAALGSGATQEAILGTTATSGTATFAGGMSIKLGRDLTVQAADGGTVKFANTWQDLSSGTAPAIAFNVGSAGNAGTVVFETLLPDSITAVNVRRGTLRLGPGGSDGDETIGFATPVSLGEAGAGGTLDVNGTLQPLASLAFAGAASSVSDGLASTGELVFFNSGSAAAVNVTGTGHTISVPLALDDAATFTVGTGGRLGISSVIANGTSGARGLTKVGDGILQLSGANTFTGNTAVSAGTLVVNGSLAQGALSVAAGATLMGSGTIGGAATIEGIHAPGNSPGVETFATNLTYSGGSSEVIWELWGNTATAGDRGSVYDGIDVGGNLDFAAATSLELDFGGLGTGTVDWDDPFWDSNQTWMLFDVAGTTSGFATNFSLTQSPSSWLDASGQAFSSSVRSEGTFSVAQDGNDVVIQYAVPEPAALALAGLGLAAAAAAIRRRP